MPDLSALRKSIVYACFEHVCYVVRGLHVSLNALKNNLYLKTQPEEEEKLVPVSL